MVFPARKPVGDWTDALPDDMKTCGAAFCRYPEEECFVEDINRGAFDAEDFFWIEGMELCLEMKLCDHEQVNEPPDEVAPMMADPLVSYVEIDEEYVVLHLECRYPQCTYTDMGFDSAEGQMQQAYNEHWNDQHG